jgi:hypothetical protein
MIASAILFVFLRPSATSHQCIHDLVHPGHQLIEDRQVYDVRKRDTRQPIRVAFDYTNLFAGGMVSSRHIDGLRSI